MCVDVGVCHPPKYESRKGQRPKRVCVCAYICERVHASPLCFVSSRSASSVEFTEYLCAHVYLFVVVSGDGSSGGGGVGGCFRTYKSFVASDYVPAFF